MCGQQSLDVLVKERLKLWPQRPPGLRMPRRGRHVWLRGRPGDDADYCHPFLKLPGSTRLRTIPDGLWLNFGGTIAEPFVDIFAIEACGTLQNLLDKRSRFAPSTHSLLALCPVPWLLAPAMAGDPTPRWQAIGVLAHPPTLPAVFPVRNHVVLYGLKQKHYDGFARHQLPHGHELFAPMEALTAEDGDKDPEMQALLQRGSPIAKFLRLP
ncbi:MAG TPA: hypothetical protein VME47_10640 [Acetobacteraceae bacterium]|nr:hypothetical protein [Acetobacteraceae bacterium]